MLEGCCSNVPCEPPHPLLVPTHLRAWTSDAPNVASDPSLKQATQKCPISTDPQPPPSHSFPFLSLPPSLGLAIFIIVGGVRCLQAGRITRTIQISKTAPMKPEIR